MSQVGIVFIEMIGVPVPNADRIKSVPSLTTFTDEAPILRRFSLRHDMRDSLPMQAHPAIRALVRIGSFASFSSRPRRVRLCSDTHGSGLARAFFTRAAAVGAAMCSA